MATARVESLFHQLHQVRECTAKCRLKLETIKSSWREYEEQVATVNTHLEENWKELSQSNGTEDREEIQRAIIRYGGELERLRNSYGIDDADNQAPYKNQINAVWSDFRETLASIIGQPLASYLQHGQSNATVQPDLSRSTVARAQDIDPTSQTPIVDQGCTEYGAQNRKRKGSDHPQQPHNKRARLAVLDTIGAGDTVENLALTACQTEDSADSEAVAPHCIDHVTRNGEIEAFKPGELYITFQEKSNEWSAVLLLPTTNLEEVGVPYTLKSLGLVPTPRCYVYTPDDDETFQWSEGYEDGGPLMGDRWYPVLYFDGREFPSKNATGWIHCRHLRSLNLGDATVRKLIGYADQASSYVEKRDVLRRKAKSLMGICAGPAHHIAPGSDAANQQPDASPSRPTVASEPQPNSVQQSTSPSGVSLSINNGDAVERAQVQTTLPCGAVKGEADFKTDEEDMNLSLHGQQPKPQGSRVQRISGSPKVDHISQLVPAREAVSQSTHQSTADGHSNRPTQDEYSTQVANPSQPVQSSNVAQETTPVAHQLGGGNQFATNAGPPHALMAEDDCALPTQAVCSSPSSAGGAPLLVRGSRSWEVCLAGTASSALESALPIEPSPDEQLTNTESRLPGLQMGIIQQVATQPMRPNPPEPVLGTLPQRTLLQPMHMMLPRPDNGASGSAEVGYRSQRHQAVRLTSFSPPYPNQYRVNGGLIGPVLPAMNHSLMNTANDRAIEGPELVGTARAGLECFQTVDEPWKRHAAPNDKWACCDELPSVNAAHRHVPALSPAYSESAPSSPTSRSQIARPFGPGPYDHSRQHASYPGGNVLTPVRVPLYSEQGHMPNDTSIPTNPATQNGSNISYDANYLPHAPAFQADPDRRHSASDSTTWGKVSTISAATPVTRQSEKRSRTLSGSSLGASQTTQEVDETLDYVSRGWPREMTKTLMDQLEKTSSKGVYTTPDSFKGPDGYECPILGCETDKTWTRRPWFIKHLMNVHNEVA